MKLIKIIFGLIVLMFISFNINVTIRALSLDVQGALYNSDTQINLTWDSVADSVYYSLQRDGIIISRIDIDKDRNYLGFTDTHLIPETTYNYTLEAYDPNGKNIGSSSVPYSTSSMKAPSITSAMLNINSKSITLNWINNSLATNSTIIYRVNPAGSLEEITSLGDDSTTITFIDPYFTSYEESSYVLVSMDKHGHYSTESLPVTITNISPPYINAEMDNNITTIYWDHMSNIHLYKLERSNYLEDAWSSWEVIKSIPKGVTSITDTPRGGTYRYRLSIDNGKYKGFTNITKPLDTILAPTNLNIVPMSSKLIDISWTNPSLSEYYLQLERRVSGENYEILALLDKNVSNYQDTDNITSNTTYYYRITAFDTSNNSSSGSENYIYTGSPSSVQDLRLDITSGTKITLNFADSSNNEQGFIIERSTNRGSFVEIASLPPNSSSFVDSTVISDKLYTYRVISFNPFGRGSSYTKEVTCSPLDIKDPPSYFEVIPISSTQINLSFTYADYSSYSTVVERKTGSDGKWSVIKILPPGFTVYSDTSLAPNTGYYYRLKNYIDENVYSRPFPNNNSGIVGSTFIKTPQNLKAYWGNGVITLTWSPLMEEGKIVIERNAGGVFVLVAQTEPGSLVWHDYNASPGVDYIYRIKCITENNSSDYSNEVTVGKITLSPPENLLCTIVSSTKVALSWEDSSSLEHGYYVEIKSSSQEEWKKISTLPKNTKSYTISNLDKNKQYYFRVSSYNSTYALIAMSTEIDVNMTTVNPPTNLTGLSQSPTQIRITWKDTSEDESYFIVEKKTGTKDFVPLNAVPANFTEFIDKDLIPGTLYQYRVRSVRKNVQSLPSNITTVTTLPPHTFTDIHSVSWAKKAIETLASRDIIKGISSQHNIFAPHDKITRAEFISLVIKTFNFEKTPFGTFTDVKPNHWFYKNVMIAKNMGIVSGTGDDYFYPHTRIKREDMAVIIARALKITGKPIPLYSEKILEEFKDKGSISPYAISGLASLYGEKIINGKGNGLIAPKDYATRAEVAVMLYNMITLYQI